MMWRSRPALLAETLDESAKITEVRKSSEEQPARPDPEPIQVRRFSEQSGEEAGEHFTARELIRPMVKLPARLRIIRLVNETA